MFNIFIYRNNRAVSPVIGSVLFVGIIVILIGLLSSPVLLALGEETEPSTEFKIEHNSDGTATVIYWNGNPIQASRVTIQVEGSTVDNQFMDEYPEQIRPGNEVTVEVDEGNTLRVIWINKKGTRSAILEEEQLGNPSESPTTPTGTPSPTLTTSSTPTSTPTPSPTPTPDCQYPPPPGGFPSHCE